MKIILNSFLFLFFLFFFFFYVNGGNFEYSCCSTQGLWYASNDFRLQALCKSFSTCPNSENWVQSQLNFNSFITNNNGVMQWNCAGNFLDSCDHNSIQILPSQTGCGSWLCAYCLNESEQWVWSCLFLNSEISNDNGELQVDGPYDCFTTINTCLEPALACGNYQC